MASGGQRGTMAAWSPGLHVSVMACRMHACYRTLRYSLTVVHIGNVTYSWYLLVLSPVVTFDRARVSKGLDQHRRINAFYCGSGGPATLCHRSVGTAFAGGVAMAPSGTKSKKMRIQQATWSSRSSLVKTFSHMQQHYILNKPKLVLMPFSNS